MKQAVPQPATFAEAVVAQLGVEPMLLNDMIDRLRDHWRRVRPFEVEQILREAGAHFRSRKHASGVAVYVASEPFDQVETFRHGIKPVERY